MANLPEINLKALIFGAAIGWVIRGILDDTEV